jgi:putative ABC transport system permease protein
MIGNYYKVAFRTIVKRKLYSFINSFGLSIGIAFCLLIFLFIQDEKSFDQFHDNKENIFLINNKRFEFMLFKNGDKEPFGETVQQNGKLGEVMLDELPEVRHMTRYDGTISGLLRYRDKVFSEKFTGVDSGFFKMFSFKLLAGNPEKVFKNKTDLVITPRVAKKYFGDEDPIGKLMTLDMNGESNFTVVGVIDAPPSNSSISFDILIPLEKSPWFRNTWDSHGYPTFVQLHSNTNLSYFRANLNKLNQKYTGNASREFRDREKIPEEFKMEELYFTNLSDIHLNTKIKWEKSSDLKYSFILGGIAILILIIACINYISLALTSSATRKTEVAIRKISGAVKAQLAIQFEIESVILAFISMIIALLLVITFLPAFNSFTNKGIVISSSNWIQFLVLALFLAFVVGIIAGSYPALYLSGLKPAKILKGGLTNKVNAWFTKPLVVIQFALSTFLIMSSVIMYRQMKFITTKDIGYNQHQVLYIPTQQGWDSKSDRFVENFRSAVVNDPSIISISGSSIPFTNGTLTLGFQNKGEAKSASSYIVDADYIPTLEIQIIKGRNFNSLNPADLKDAIIVNEALVKEMKWVDPLNEHLNWHFEDGLGSKVIGVVKDHNFLSLERAIDPMFLTMDKTFGHYQYILVKLSSTDISGSIKKLEKAYKELAPDKPFEYTFLDEKVAMQYQSYERWINIITLTTGFAILISCLGLFGLAGTNVVNRTKEIGIRKVLGSGVSDIFVLLNKQFVWLSAIAFVLATFPAWYAMNKWLNSFQFKIEMSWVLFAVSMGVGLLVVLITVSYHTLKAINVNPAETLKYE